MPELTSSDVGKVNFDAKWYLQAYPDVANAGIDPKVHYEAHGWGEVDFLVFWRRRALNPLCGAALLLRL